jgi:hypothetical protein
METNKDKINQLLGTGTMENFELACQLAKSQNMQEECYYLMRFDEMLNYLRQFEHIDIINYAFYPGEPKEIEKVEKQIGKPLKPETRNFFEQTNGIELYWLDKRNDGYQNLKSATYPDYGVDGFIDIRGVWEIYNDNSLDTYGYGNDLMDKQLTAEEVSATYHSFDYFSVYNDMMAYTGEGFEDNPLLIMGDDHQACWTDSRLMHIPAYMELVFHSCGSIEGRRRLLKKYNGHKLPILDHDRAWFDQYQRPDFKEYPAPHFFPESTFWS